MHEESLIMASDMAVTVVAEHGIVSLSTILELTTATGISTQGDASTIMKNIIEEEDKNTGGEYSMRKIDRWHVPINEYVLTAKVTSS